MKKTVISLSLCVFVLGIGILSIPKVDASPLKDSSEVKDSVNNQMSTLEGNVSNAPETNTSDGGFDANAINQINEVSAPSFISDNTLAIGSDTSSTPAVEEKSARNTTVNNENQLENAVNSGGTITIGRSFTVRSQLSYRNDFTIIGNGNTLTFTGTGGFFSGSGSGANISISGLTMKSSVTYTAPGATALFSYEGNGTLNLQGVNYTTTTGCPLVATDNVSAPITVNFSGDNNLKTSGSGAPDTTLLKNIGNINVNGGKTIIEDDTPNKSGEFFGQDCYSAIKLWSGSSHKITIADESALDINSSKYILFDLNGSLAMDIGSKANFTYTNKSNGKQNQIIGATGDASSSGTFAIKVGEGSQTLFQTNGVAANFSGLSVQVEANSPEYVQFKSSVGGEAIKKGANVTFKNLSDNTGTGGDYILGETPVSSSVEKKTSVPVGGEVALGSGSFQDVIYYKEKIEETIGLKADCTTGDNVSTIITGLTGAYTNYDGFDLLVSPVELTDNAIGNAILAAQNDATGQSGYYQSGSILSGGALPNVTNVWANTYYIYAQLTNSSTGKTSLWIKSTLLVPEVKSINADGAINFIGGFGLSALSTAKLTNAGNTERVLQYNNFTQNAGSSENVSLVSGQATGDKELLLNVTAENNNSSSSWGPLTLNNNNLFYSQVILSPYWTGSGNSDANFTVNGSYSGPLGKNQIETVSYTLSMSIYTNN